MSPSTSSSPISLVERCKDSDRQPAPSHQSPACPRPCFLCPLTFSSQHKCPHRGLLDPPRGSPALPPAPASFPWSPCSSLSCGFAFTLCPFLLQAVSSWRAGTMWVLSTSRPNTALLRVSTGGKVAARIKRGSQSTHLGPPTSEQLTMWTRMPTIEGACGVEEGGAQIDPWVSLP